MGGLIFWLIAVDQRAVWPLALPGSRGQYHALACVGLYRRVSSECMPAVDKWCPSDAAV